MPFITKIRRAIIDSKSLAALGDIQPGDLCYLHYKKMVDKWREDRRWTTAHNIYEALGIHPSVAEQLAWQVFFQLHVMPYELEKQKENGDI